MENYAWTVSSQLRKPCTWIKERGTNRKECEFTEKKRGGLVNEKTYRKGNTGHLGGGDSLLFGSGTTGFTRRRRKEGAQRLAGGCRRE